MLFSFGVSGLCLQQLERERPSPCLRLLSLFRPHPLSHTSAISTACSPLFQALPQSAFYTGHRQVTFPSVQTKTFVVPFYLWLTVLTTGPSDWKAQFSLFESLTLLFPRASVRVPGLVAQAYSLRYLETEVEVGRHEVRGIQRIHSRIVYTYEPGMEAHVCNLSTWKAEAENKSPRPTRSI